MNRRAIGAPSLLEAWKLGMEDQGVASPAEQVNQIQDPRAKVSANNICGKQPQLWESIWTVNCSTGSEDDKTRCFVTRTRDANKLLLRQVKFEK